MIDYCPNCGSKDVEKLSDTEIYCKPCDSTFEIRKGKATNKPSGRLQQLEDSIEKINEDNRQIKKDLYGREDFF